MVRVIFNYTALTNFYAEKLARSYNFSANTRFAFKGLLTESPMMTNFWLVIISMVWFTFLSRTLERPYHDANGDMSFNNWANVCYFVMQTMTTIGYGDLLPISFQGKALAMIIAYYGVFMMSLFVAIATLQLTMNN